LIWYTKISGWKTNLNNQFIKRLAGGWGNGYVAVPPTHPAYKMDYDTLMYNINVHGNLTYSQFGDGKNAPKEWWVFGFDTNHYTDDINIWPKEAVEAETKRLYCQLLDIEWGEL
jgi:signal peptidase I